MYKRAFMYSSNAPITIFDENEKDENDSTNKTTDIEYKNLELEPELIKTHPGNKVSYCVCCKGKTFLNKESIYKHLKSKNHLKNVKKNEKNNEKAKKIKEEFLKRMKEVDNKSYST
ncbi:conserved hypothetical protein [Theileria orientalis strain Shintoku]|uniref:Uncharacterized protein n=1 Tax=Theileria orientalis strain Shintoku TaxID=869250 RepID=J4CDZ7_THEOR|nr:conserved hypothetical protein [Theileria orientalis strain Shintoku]BAM42012.1 conserved hypothetical protein [Theileria orientalis strain Shintoku]|eukprot:XP_009692313.1 conserved hypothetical protein [Theileria orientalis strain Shintoku]